MCALLLLYLVSYRTSLKLKRHSQNNQSPPPHQLKRKLSMCNIAIQGHQYQSHRKIRNWKVLQLSKSSQSKNGGAYFSAVCGSNLVPVSATEAHWHRVCDRLLGFFSRAHFFCFPEVCRAQSCSACRPTLWKYGWKDDKYLWAPKSQTAAATAANVWSGCKTFKGPQRARIVNWTLYLSKLKIIPICPKSYICPNF